MSFIFSEYSRFLFLWVLLLSTTPARLDATCHRYSRFLNCRMELPRREQLTVLGKDANVLISNFKGDLEADASKKEDVYSVQSLQIQNSEIHRIAPYFFSNFSAGSLETLVLNSINGSFELNRQTLGNLEDTLKSIRVSGHRIGDISYLANLMQLNTLYLGLTQLDKVPANFGQLLSRLVNVDLSKNNLAYLPWDALARRIREVDFQRIRLVDNPWHCNCSLLPLLQVPDELLDKISEFYCATPSEVSGFTLREFRVANLCKPPPEEVATESKLGGPVIPGEPGDSSRGENANDGVLVGSVIGSKGGHGSDRGTGAEGQQTGTEQVASAGLSTEVIAVIVAVIVVVVIVIIAVIAFKARQSSQRRQQASQKQPSQKSNAYCAVIEHPPSPRGGSGAPKPGTAGVHNNYNRDMDRIERQPLAPGYRDNRL